MTSTCWNSDCVDTKIFLSSISSLSPGAMSSLKQNKDLARSASMAAWVFSFVDDDGAMVWIVCAVYLGYSFLMSNLSDFCLVLRHSRYRKNSDCELSGTHRYLTFQGLKRTMPDDTTLCGTETRHNGNPNHTILLFDPGIIACFTMVLVQHDVYAYE
jgi:hypothetical protein